MQCNLCENVTYFKKMDYLNNHLKKFHNGKNNNICRICRKEFKNYYILKAQGDYKSICNFCGITFKYKNLKNHYTIHMNERNHKCNICDAAFKNKCDLMVHNRLHTGERPFLCNICDERFIANTNLNKHMKRVFDRYLILYVNNKLYESLYFVHLFTATCFLFYLCRNFN